MNPMPKRSYKQHCSLATVLDVVGERWTFLIIRELLLGPRRFTDLARNLSGMGANLLTDRLREMESTGLVEKTTLPRSAGRAAYQLTDEGRELEPVILHLIRWGARLLGKPKRGQTFSAGWTLLAMKAHFNPAAARGMRESLEYRINDEVFHARIFGSKLTTGAGPARNPTMILTTDQKTFQQLSSGDLAPGKALKSGKIQLQGKLQTLIRTGQLFALPGKTSPPSGSLRRGTKTADWLL
jgi:DNA-binding HxlR family transcriptional regulator/putative sterol carrier protein